MSGVASDKNKTTKDYEIDNIPQEKTENIEKKHFVNKNLKGEDAHYVTINQEEDVFNIFIFTLALFKKNKRKRRRGK